MSSRLFHLLLPSSVSVAAASRRLRWEEHLRRVCGEALWQRLSSLLQ